MTKPCRDCVNRTRNKDGYYPIMDKRYKMMHRKVYSKTHNDYVFKPGDVVRHTCDNPWCVEPTHLILGTQTDNVQDSVDRGRHKNPSFTGSENPWSVIDEEVVLKIRMYREKYKFSHQDIADMLKIGRHIVTSVLSGKTWKHVGKEEASD